MTLGKTKLQSLISKSENIFSIFEKTKNDIIAVNNEIETEAVDRLDKIRSLNTEVEILNIQKSKNEKVLLNIDKFFE
jgi:hypothetical protein